MFDAATIGMTRLISEFLHGLLDLLGDLLRSAVAPIEDLVREVAALGQQAVALTDDGLYGAVRFYKAAVTAGIQPILGARLSLWDGSFITLLASDFGGYGNLCRTRMGSVI